MPDPDISFYKSTPWRFIDDGEHSSAFNMARDEALARSSRSGSVPTLRVYRFKPAAVSIGRFQKVTGSIDMEACKRERIDVVRRPTGGLAILHSDDFTYSVCLPRRPGKVDSRDRYFAVVAGGLLDTLRQLGIKGRVVAHMAVGVPDSPWCFEGAFGVDIEWQQRKICGSAQRLYKESMLQHGSFFLKVDTGLLGLISSGDRTIERAYSGAGEFVSVAEAAGRAVTWEYFCTALMEGFSKFLSREPVQARCSEEEELLTDRLYETKYSRDDWTF